MNASDITTVATIDKRTTLFFKLIDIVTFYLKEIEKDIFVNNEKLAYASAVN